jgi:L-ribulose-5-phosphate 3-epimerase
MLTFGVRGHDFGKAPVAELAGKIAAKKFTSLQLALSKALSEPDCSPGQLNPALAKHIGRVFATHNIEIAVVGCYINPVHPDPLQRAKELAHFQEHLRFAADFGCRIVGTETGSVNADCSFHPASRTDAVFKEICASVAQLVETAERHSAFVGVEAVIRHTIHSPQRLKQLLDSIGSDNLQVIFDPVNLLDINNYQEQDRIIQESFDLFGERMLVLHAKDFQIRDGQFETVPAGRGLLDYPLLIKLIKQAKPYVYTLFEEINPADLDAGRDYLTSLLG